METKPIHHNEQPEINNGSFDDRSELLNTISSLMNENEALKLALQAEHYAATHDRLTGLANSRGREEFMESPDFNFKDKLFFFIDLNNFGKINKELGHSQGNEVLKTIATTLQSLTRQSGENPDFISREGGDEFLLIAHKESREDSNEDTDEGEQILKIKSRIMNGINDYLLDYAHLREIGLGLAIGASAGSTENSFSEVLHAADLDMQEHKINSRSEDLGKMLGKASLQTYAIESHIETGYN